ncbi:MAG: glutathione synthase [Hyphomicrobiaceae bacterium]|nr:glutathione synthase [Hyphomicrobiaceae bacterium]
MKSPAKHSSRLKVGVQMDPIEGIGIAGDTSFALLLEAQRRCHDIAVFEPRHVAYDCGTVRADVRWVSVADVAGAHFEVKSAESIPLDTFDIILIRQDPPFDTAYLANTFLLEQLETRVVMMNSPRGIRNFSEKLRTLDLQRFMPETYVGSTVEGMRAFATRFDQVVIKPLFLGGGASVAKTSATDPAFDAKVASLMAEAGKEPLIVQRFIPEIVHGDKRVFVIDGAVAGVLRRVPNAGDFRANIHVGGAAHLDALTPSEEPVSAAVAALCQREGILFAGIDLIHGLLNEVNVTSPTLFREYLRLSGIDLTRPLMDVLEARVAALPAAT